MADITNNKQVQCSQLAFNTTPAGGSVADLGGVVKVILRTSADCYVDFDQPIATSQSFKLFAADSQPTEIEVHGGLINRVFAQGVSTSGTLFIIAVV